MTQSGAAKSVIVTGNTDIRASGKDITLGSAGNNFGTVLANGAVVSITDTNALVLGDSTATTGLTLTANGAITQSGNLTAGTLSVT